MTKTAIPVRDVYITEAAYIRLIQELAAIDPWHPCREAHIAEALGEAGVWSDCVFDDPGREPMLTDPIPTFRWSPPRAA